MALYKVKRRLRPCFALRGGHLGAGSSCSPLGSDIRGRLRAAALKNRIRGSHALSPAEREPPAPAASCALSAALCCLNANLPADIQDSFEKINLFPAWPEFLKCKFYLISRTAVGKGIFCKLLTHFSDRSGNSSARF